MNLSNNQYHLYTLLVIGLLIPNINGSREVKYVGCMKQTSGSNSLKERGHHPEGANVRICVEHCWERRRRYVGLQNSQCYCSPTLADVVSVAESECFKRCNLNCQQICGGDTTFSVYHTGYKREPICPISNKALLKAQIGCYNFDSRHYMCRGHPSLETIRLTMPLCVYYCASYHNMKFATTITKSKCCCTNSIGRARRDRMPRCNIQCRGDYKKGFGCVGKYRDRILMSTIEISRLPAFKKFPASVFKDAQWQLPLFPGEKFEIKDKPVVAVSWEKDPSLQGLVVKRPLTPPPGLAASAEGEGGVVADKAVVSLAGGDQRENALGGVGKSVAVSEVSGRAESSAPTKEEANKYIVGAVIAAFVIIIVATGFYFYKNSETDIDDNGNSKKKSKKKKKKKRASETSTNS